MEILNCFQKDSLSPIKYHYWLLITFRLLCSCCKNISILYWSRAKRKLIEFVSSSKRNWSLKKKCLAVIKCWPGKNLSLSIQWTHLSRSIDFSELENAESIVWRVHWEINGVSGDFTAHSVHSSCYVVSVKHISCLFPFMSVVDRDETFSFLTYICFFFSPPTCLIFSLLTWLSFRAASCGSSSRSASLANIFHRHLLFSMTCCFRNCRHHLCLPLSATLGDYSFCFFLWVCRCVGSAKSQRLGWIR